VAKFLGTPQINLYDAQLLQGKCLINGQVVFQSAKLEREKVKEVVMGVRPEGYELDTQGPLELTPQYIETIGRDLSLVATNKAAQTPSVRVILSNEGLVLKGNQPLRFKLKPAKTFVFEKSTGRRLA
jgi:multiple sugar transport system ATP-binding protein